MDWLRFRFVPLRGVAPFRCAPSASNQVVLIHLLGLNPKTPRGRGVFEMVVGVGFEPTEDKSSRFTVCPRWPLEYPTERTAIPRFQTRSSRAFLRLKHFCFLGSLIPPHSKLYASPLNHSFLTPIIHPFHLLRSRLLPSSRHWTQVGS